jgi:hypothetical protein
MRDKNKTKKERERRKLSSLEGGELTAEKKEK